MAYNEGLVERLRMAMQDEQEITERKMFGGVSFLVAGNLAVCANNQGDLMVRVDPAAVEPLLDEPGVARMEMGARLMKGWVRITLPTVEAEADLRVWVDRGLDYARSLPSE